MPKLSIVISASDNDQHITTCLDSILAQTMKDIEVICIDNSNDSDVTYSIEEYTSRDSRLSIVNNDDHLSLSQIRKIGVLTTTGDYVMFLDGKSELIITACEIVSNALAIYHPDILQFGLQEIDSLDTSSVLDIGNQVQTDLEPTILQDVNLLNCCWLEELFDYSLNNKIIDGNLCRKAFSLHEDGQFLYGDDLYSFFLIAYFSHSYISISNALCLHHSDWNLCNSDIRTLADYDDLLMEKHVYNCLEKFIQQQTDTSEDINEILSTIYYHFLSDCVQHWRSALDTTYLSDGFEHLINTWGLKDTICMLAKQTRYREYSIAEKILQVNSLHYKPIHITYPLTIAAYYHSISGGGAQRVVAELCNIWSMLYDNDGNHLYNVILITDMAPDDNEYPLNPKIHREYLPDYKTSIGLKYGDRFDAWNEILTHNNIDFIISSGWNGSDYSFWDLLSIRGISPSTAITFHSQNFNCVPFSFSGSSGLKTTRLYMLSDGVVTLSDSDRKFAECFSNNVKHINNPLTFDPYKMPSSTYCANTLLWIGRISKEKQPLDAIYMMKEIAQEIPDAVLYIVGDGDAKIYNDMQSTITELSLKDNIKLIGYTLNVDEYYSQASILISTSEYEGYSLVFAEAMAYAIPIITYDMPWLAFIKDGRGIITVPQKRYDLLAKQAISLLKAPVKGKSLGELGKQQICEIDEEVIKSNWKEFIHNTVFDIKNTDLIDPDIKIMFDYLAQFQQVGRERLEEGLRKQISNIKGENNKLLITIKNERKEHTKLSKKLKESEKEQALTSNMLHQTKEKQKELLKNINEREKEKDELSKRLDDEKNKQIQTMHELSQISDKLKQADSEQDHLSHKLSQTQKEKFKLIKNIRIIDNELVEVKDQLEQSNIERSEINKKLEAMHKEIYDREARIKELEDTVNDHRNEIDAIHSSATYKIGRTITWPVRKPRDLRK